MTASTMSQHPLRVLETEAPLPAKECSVLLTQHGVGKTAVLMNFGLDRLLQGQTVCHFTSSMSTEKTFAYYYEIYTDFAQHFFELDTPAWDKIKPNLTVVSYPDPKTMTQQLKGELTTIHQQTEKTSALVIVDDLNYFSDLEQHMEAVVDALSVHESPILAGVTVHRDHSGYVPLDEPASSLEPFSKTLYYMEPDPSHDRVLLESVKNGRPTQLPLFFDPHKLIFRLQ